MNAFLNLRKVFSNLKIRKFVRHQTNDVHSIIKYIELKKHIYDDIEPENKFIFKAVTEHPLSKLYSKIFDESFAIEDKIDFKGEFEIDGKFYGQITDKNIKEISKLATKSHFGKNDQTVYDESIRKAKEIEGSRIKLKNFDISKILDYLSEKYAVKLTSILHKLVIYEKDGHFKPHKDTVHHNNHIASLLIGLPINYEGGLLNISYPNDPTKHKSFKLFNNFVAFYTDCDHWICEVKDGARVVLQYDLMVVPDKTELIKKRSKEKLSAQVLNKITKHKRPVSSMNQYNSFWIEKLENELLKIDFSRKKIGFLLRHQYANKNLYPEILKGTDKAIYDSFKNKFDLDLRHVILDIEKFVDLDLFYIKCKAFKRCVPEEDVKNEEDRGDTDELTENEQEYRDKVKLSEEIVLEHELEDEDEKPCPIDLILTDLDRYSLIEKKRQMNSLEMMQSLLTSLFILQRQFL